MREGEIKLLKKDYVNMTNHLVEYILKFEGSCTGYVPTQKAKEEVIYRVKQIMENCGVEFKPKERDMKWEN